jgi:site-specific DNA recombinase
VSASRLDEEVWKYVQNLLLDAELLRQYYQASQESANPNEGSEAEEEARRLERKIQGQEREVQRLIDGYVAEAISLEELKERRQRIEEQKRILSGRLAQLKRQQVSREEEKKLLEGVDEFCESLREAVVNPSFEIKQKILRLVVDTIVVESDKIIVKHIVPT